MKKIMSSKMSLLLVAILGVFLVMGCAPLPVVDTTPPTVLSTVPADGATGVASNATITAAFSEAMDPLTITAATFILQQGATAVTGTVAYTGTTATFTPAALASGALYTATITTGAKDAAGNALANTVWTFTTQDLTAPSVSSTVPVNNATNVATNSSLTATFSEEMDAATIVAANFTVAAGATPVAGVVTYDSPSKTATFNPDSDFTSSTIYTATIATGVKDVSGNALAVNNVWSFTSGTVPDFTAPTVISKVPAASAPAAAVNGNITATFSEPMDPATIIAANFTVVVTTGGVAVTGTVTYDTSSNTAIFYPGSDLGQSTGYTATVTTGVKDLAGNAMAANMAWTFTTVADTTPPTVSLTVPVLNATGVAVNSYITATFSEAMLSGSIISPATTFTIAGVTGTVAYTGTTATFTPDASLAYSTAYTATITTGATDIATNPLVSAYVWSFTTGASGVATDNTAPTVMETFPLNSALIVPINSNITATFSEALSPASITTSTFTLKQGLTTVVTGTVAFSGTTATLNPVSDLAYNTGYTATITIGATDLAGNALATAKVWNFQTGSAPDVTAPTVSSMVPVDSALNVAANSNIVANFSEAMNPQTISTATFTLKLGTTPVVGTVAYLGTAATFDPGVNLAYDTLYTATVTTGAKDLAGNALTTNKVWSFRTGTAPDTTAPTVNAAVPANSATNVAIASNVTATFSEAMNPLTITTATFTFKQGTTVVPGTLAYSSTTNTATINPDLDLAFNTLYTATITTGVQDVAGNALAAGLVWTFTTIPNPDVSPPTVSSTSPADTATGVAIDSSIKATFSEAMDPAQMIAANFTVTSSGGAVTAGTFSYDIPNKTVTFPPTSNLLPNTLYTATVTTGVIDLAGIHMTANKVWTFTTVAATALGPAPVRLGTAGNFVILAKTAITTVPDSIITGDIGVSPAAESYMTGFSQTKATGYSTAPQVTGFLYAADQTPPTPANMTTAISDMELAYTDAAGRTQSVVNDLGGGTIGGLTFAPGLYKWTSNILITTNITIAGAANDVWIFQTTNDLILASAKSIILSGGAQAKNIFWQVAGYVQLGTGSHFEGIMLCQTQVTMETGSSINGRILAQTQVALQQATVTKPAQ